ncbi:MAG: Ig-like domain-containing protein [Bacteroidales bacterium]|nr:Ig-like domain-containing protein [Bacteroidales bacterium]
MRPASLIRQLGHAAAPLAFLASLAWGCANPGTPTGGPRDRKPPVMISSTPAPGATDFKGKVVTIIFDENVQLKDADKKFVMSPPTAKKPRVEAHAKTLSVRFDDEEELQPATTYTLDFADCLSDLNEGNVYENFTFSFSTGQSTDSMMISGNVFDAQTILPVEGIYVLLHANLTDTAFSKTTPIRIAKTDARGRFAIKNVPAGAQYDIYALDDQNRNFLFDQPGEKIAWLGRHVTPSFETRQVADSVRTDSTFVLNDTVRYYYQPITRDTLVYTPDSLVIFAFDEDVYDQYVKSDERKSRNIITLALNKPMSRRPKVSFPGNEGRDVARFQYNPANDTVKIWMTDTTVWHRDSVVVAINYLMADSLGNLIDKVDTLKEWHFERKVEEPKQKRRNKKKTEEKPKPKMLELKVATSVAPYSELAINATTPFETLVWDSVRLFVKQDTIFNPVKFTPVEDTVNICHKALKFKWEPGAQYKLEIDSAAARDIYGLVNDAVSASVKITSLDKYGTLYIDVDSVPRNALIQITDAKGGIVRQSYLKPNGKAGFKYLKQGEYKIRILIDDNHDGKWTTGNYAERRQPETIIYYMEKVSVRPNWDIHVNFSTKGFSPDAYARKFGNQTTRRRR